MTSTPRRLDPLLVRRAKGWIKGLALRRGLLVRKLPQGRQGDAFFDQAALLKGRDPHIVFDVGAYLGETALTYRRLFPNATIHCFEPVPESFVKLSAALANEPRVRLNPLVISDGTQPVEMHVNRFAGTSSMLSPSRDVGAYLSSDLFEEVVTHQVRSTTLDSYCADQGVDQIDVLKLDIQGAESTALRGATGLLSRGAISLIYTELLVAPMYEGQGTIGDLLGLCERHGFRLYGLYNFEYGADTRLFQMDAILISPKLAAPQP